VLLVADLQYRSVRCQAAGISSSSTAGYAHAWSVTTSAGGPLVAPTAKRLRDSGGSATVPWATAHKRAPSGLGSAISQRATISRCPALSTQARARSCPARWCWMPARVGWSAGPSTPPDRGAGIWNGQGRPGAHDPAAGGGSRSAGAGQRDRAGRHRDRSL
jgi:hypothetical protein